MLKQIIHLLKSSQSEFDSVCRSAGLNLNYDLNKAALSVLKEVFISREYADYFPFYQKSVIFDVGAHYGYFSIFAAKNSDPDSRIIALEPAKDNFKILNQNISWNKLENITSLNLALSDKNISQELYQGKSVNYSFFSKDQNTLSSFQSETVQAVTLSKLLEQVSLTHIDFLKMDCEGAEYPIILNSDAETLKKIKVLSLEFHDLKQPDLTGNHLVNHLEKNGYKIVKYNYSPTTMNLNFGKLIAINLNINVLLK